MEFLIWLMVAGAVLLVIVMSVALVFHIFDDAIFDGKLTKKFKRWAQSKVNLDS